MVIGDFNHYQKQYDEYYSELAKYERQRDWNWKPLEYQFKDKTGPESKKMVDLPAARPQYRDWDFLKHDTSIESLNYQPKSNVNDTRFYRGFYRRQYCDIQAEIGRSEPEQRRELRRKSSCVSLPDIRSASPIC